MNIILHLGFPKTGSSTFQYGLFKHLENEGFAELKMWRKDDPLEHHDFRPSSRLFKKLPMLEKSIDFSHDSEKINILTDESFTAPTRLRRNNYGDDIPSPFSFPSLIKDQLETNFGSSIKIIPLIILRNQADLIFSQYVEEYNLVLYRNTNILFSEDGDINLEGYDIYKFSEYIETLLKDFERNDVKILLFEEWKKSPDTFYRKIAEIIDVDENIVSNCLTTSHYNKKEKSQDGYYTKNSNKFIPFLSDTQRHEIISQFRESNKKLQNFGFSLETLKDYGYL